MRGGRRLLILINCELIGELDEQRMMYGMEKLGKRRR
jgi:hypothetical protein